MPPRRPNRPSSANPGSVYLPAAAVSLTAVTVGAWMMLRPTCSTCLQVEAGRCVEDLLATSTWSALNASARATLFAAGAEAGLLGSDLQSCGTYMTAALFRHGGVDIRGAAASKDIEAGFVCAIGEDELISVATVRAMLGSEFIGLQELPGSRGEGVVAAPSGETLKRRTSEDRALMAVLLLRERSRAKSRLAPYIHTFLQLPEGVPAGWDSDTPLGAERRSMLKATHPALLEKADMLRAVIAQKYAQLVPEALKRLPDLLSEGLPCSENAACEEEELARFYSVERFAEVWLAISSRDFVNSLQEKSSTPLDGAYPFPTTFLVPLFDLMNHDRARPTTEVSYDARRRGFVMQTTRFVRKGEELLFSYGAQLCRENALGRYGFADPDMDPCPS